ncbi:hypothetical protein [Streptomyces sp. SD31]|uniref:hypothetical protein n=1 Tax=Streptomyces sp. SD31 TaxID=3452208 RepID=UPI003F8BBC6C
MWALEYVAALSLKRSYAACAGVLLCGEFLSTRGGINHVVGGDDHRLCGDVRSRVGHEELWRDQGRGMATGIPTATSPTAAVSSSPGQN